MKKNLDILFVHTNASNIIYQDLSKDHSAIEPPIWAGMLANSCRAKNRRFAWQRKGRIRPK